MTQWISPISIPIDFSCSDACDDRPCLHGDRSIEPHQWLLSIRDRSEWPIACRSGAQIIDFKEPRRGPLAPTDPDLWQWATRQPRCPAWLSAAMGEPSDALEIAEQVPSHFRFAKVGPSGCDTPEKLTQMWTAVHERLRPPIELVAVAYADANEAGCLDVEKVLAAAHSHGFTRVLIDTFTKDGRSTIDHLGFQRLAAISRWSIEKKIWWGLAGSIKLASMADLAGHAITPNCFGVRGDVCADSRNGNICEQKIRAWDSAMSDSTR